MKRSRFHLFGVNALAWTILLAATSSVLVPGCSTAPSETEIPSEPLAELPDDAALLATLDEVIDWNRENRLLNLQDHAAWQVLHGIVAYGRALPIEKEPGGERVMAVDYLLGGGAMNGWDLRPGIVLDAETDRRGLIAELEFGSKTGQGHADQWLGYMAYCGLQASETIVAGDRTYTIEDFIRQVQWDVPRVPNQEYSWTLMGLSSYLPTTAAWEAQDGRTWSIEKLVEIETQQDVATSACGGTHRLFALCAAVNNHVAAGHPLEGVWEAANRKILDSVQAARQYQNSNGSFSSNYFRRGGRTADLALDLGVSGHVLEFLMLALTDEQLSEPWVKRGVVHVCDVLQKTRAVPLECGALYHAIHALILYRQRVFGAAN